MLWRYPILWLSLWLLLGVGVYAADHPGPALEPIPLTFAPAMEGARAAYLAGDWKAAVVSLQRFLRERPTDSPQAVSARFLLAESMAQLRRYEDASRQYQALQKASLSDEQRSHVDFRVAELALFRGDNERAAKLFRGFRARHETHRLDQFALPYLAKATAQLGDTANARALYELATAKYPAGTLTNDSQLRLALLDYDDGLFDAAKNRLAQVVATVSNEDSLHWDALYWLGMAEWKTEVFDRAASHLTLLREQRPNHQYAEASAYFAAQALYRSARSIEAANAFRQLHERRRDSEYAVPAQLGELRCLAVATSATTGLEPNSEASLKRATHLYQQLTESANSPYRAAATRVFAEVLLAQEQYQQAWDLMQPTVEQTVGSPGSPGDWEARYRGVYTAALALRGIRQSSRAHELLGRVRLRLCSPALADQVQLARMQTATDVGNIDAAIQLGRNLEGHPKGGFVDNVRVELVRAQIEAGRLEEAHATLRRMQASSTRSSVVQATRMLAEASFAADDLGTARELYEALLKWRQSDADHFQALSGLAWIDSKEGRYEQAVTRFEQLLTVFPDHTGSLEAQRMLAKSLANLGERGRAVRVLTAFQGMDAGETQRAPALYQLSLLLQETPARRQDALRVIRQLIEEHPGYSRIDAAWYLRGTLELENDPESAERSFLQLVNHHPTSDYWSDALYRLAEMRVLAKDTASAQKYLTKLVTVQKNPRVVPHALYLKGKIETSQKQWVASRATLRQLIQEFPDSPLTTVARYGIAESFYQQKYYDHAERLFDILAGQELPANEPWQAMIRLRRAQLFVRKSKYLEAIQNASLIEQTFDNFKLQHEADYVIGRAHAGRGEFSRAREYYQQVVERDPEYRRELTAIAKWMLGETHIHQRDYARALPHFEQLIVVHGHPRWRALSLLQSAKCYEKLGQQPQAKQRFGQLVQDFPETEWAGEATYRLDLMDRVHAPQAEK